MRHVFLLVFLSATVLQAQKPAPADAVSIHNNIKKLNFLGTALYVAAHPDDENTRLISYLSNHVHARTGYLSLTRGDGGQNLVGPEIREQLGLIRTQELLAARRVDGGEQRFTRANDFGYSKHPDETLKIWNKDQVLGDVVWAIRTFRPDIIINRFNHRTPGTTHGHHTSSAMLSVEAFDLVNNKKAYPKQLEYTSIWQPKRLYFNTSWWFYGSRENFEKADKGKLQQVDVGVFYPSSGRSNNEIASIASSQHLSQGFGRVSSRGSQEEYVEFLKGEQPEGDDLFSGINTTWSRLEGGKAIGDILYNVEEDFDFTNPAASIPQLLKAQKLIKALPSSHYKTLKLEEITEIIIDCAGLYLEVTVANATAAPVESIELNYYLLNRSNREIKAQLFVASNNIKIPPSNRRFDLLPNQPIDENVTATIAKDAGYTSPYWLEEKGTTGMYTVKDQDLIGQPENDSSVSIHFQLVFTVDGEQQVLDVKRPVVYKYSLPEKGELYKPFAIVPKISLSMADDVIVFSNTQAKEIKVALNANSANQSGELKLQAPKGFSITPATIPFELNQKGSEFSAVFTVSPPAAASQGTLSAQAKTKESTYTNELITIDYDHIPTQYIVTPATAKVVKLDVKKKGSKVVYIEGAGDVVPESIMQLGYEVAKISPQELSADHLIDADAVVVGIRAYNISPELRLKNSFILDYVKSGGNVIVQYNTSRRLNFDELAPYPLSLSRDRVTDEFAAVKFLTKEHPVLNQPNNITKADFEDWVQERGLYFPNEWDDAYTPILGWNDQGESLKKGSLLIAPYGKGNYIYTGISFFRQFPAGVSGAYRLFANMLSLGK
ncbi:PIG-L family deacetylase [Gangjinia marincola]|uniref:PIG-L family deacetylase n=1 Tax=Gangjinia marincola TaxID=578463 RepID=A0ABN1MCW3_9FLAO